MPQYRRFYVPGGTYFFTLVTYERQPLFSQPENVSLLRQAVATVKSEMPFTIVGAVVLPDHLHFIWTLPNGDSNYSKRVGRLKVLFTQSLRGKNALPNDVSISRQKHRESNIWHRRFWEHTIQGYQELEAYLNYIHYNPVKHGLVTCPHLWEYSSFHSWVKKEIYSPRWCCICTPSSGGQWSIVRWAMPTLHPWFPTKIHQMRSLPMGEKINVCQCTPS